MIFINRAFIYRFGVFVRELGEHMGRIPVIRIFSGAVISLGLAVTGRALDYGTGEPEKK